MKGTTEKTKTNHSSAYKQTNLDVMSDLTKAGGCEGLSLGLAAWQTDLTREACTKFTLECWESGAIMPRSRQKGLEDRIYVKQRKPWVFSAVEWVSLIHLQKPPPPKLLNPPVIIQIL